MVVIVIIVMHQLVAENTLNLFLSAFDLARPFLTSVFARIGSEQQSRYRTDDGTAQKRKKAMTFHNPKFKKFDK